MKVEKPSLLFKFAESLDHLDQWPCEELKKPYGTTRVYKVSDDLVIWVLHIAPNQRLSNKQHFKRDEFVLILDDDMLVETHNEEPVKCNRGDFIVVPRNVFHRISAGPKGGRMLKMEYGVFDRLDFKRTEDDYGRPLVESLELS